MGIASSFGIVLFWYSKRVRGELRCEVTEMTSAFGTYQTKAAVIFPERVVRALFKNFNQS
jgi:hypothetical protein